MAGNVERTEPVVSGEGPVTGESVDDGVESIEDCGGMSDPGVVSIAEPGVDGGTDVGGVVEDGTDDCDEGVVVAGGASVVGCVDVVLAGVVEVEVDVDGGTSGADVVVVVGFGPHQSGQSPSQQAAARCSHAPNAAAESRTAARGRRKRVWVMGFPPGWV